MTDDKVTLEGNAFRDLIEALQGRTAEPAEKKADGDWIYLAPGEGVNLKEGECVAYCMSLEPGSLPLIAYGPIDDVHAYCYKIITPPSK